jgi:hypothetical protein
MLLRSGNIYQVPIDLNQVILIQSLIRGYHDYHYYLPYRRAIHSLVKNFPHLYHYKIKKKRISNTTKKSNKKSKNNTEINIDENEVQNDIEYIIEQYHLVKNLGTCQTNGLLRSTRKNKGKQPVRYVDDNFVKIMLEDDNIEDILASGSDIDSNYHSDADFDSEEEDQEWDNLTPVSESELEFSD